uniref:Uncharacterized protein n=1 Tax=Nymphaea colorata TaxID=210225 RepID=A0A5K1F8J3_9MAGN|nr:unnamed protein product [Nymphaea colorata]
MEINSDTRAKRLQNVLSVAISMVKKGFTPKRKLAMVMQRGKKLGRSFRRIFFPHRFQGFRPQAYEFSSSGSPLFHAGTISGAKMKLHYCFPSLPYSNPPHADDSDDHVIINEPQLELSASDLSNIDLADGDKISPSISLLPSEDDDEEHDATVDEKVEEFIAPFFEQLRSQGRR